MLKLIHENDFNEALSGVSVVDFSATWCGPCRMMAPIIEQVSEELTDIRFFKVDVDDDMDLASRYSIANIPTILIMKDGQVASQLIGFNNADTLKSEIKRII